MDIRELNGNELPGQSGFELVEFYSETPPEDRMERLSAEYKEIGFSRTDLRFGSGLADSLGIGDLPAYVLFSDGREIGRSHGEPSDRSVKALIDRETLSSRGKFPNEYFF